MNSSAQFLNPAEAARRLGVSAKALRLYEQRGLIAPLRSQSGWRSYGPGEMARAGEIVALRALGLSLAQVAQVLNGDPQSLPPALAAHQAMLERQGRALADQIDKVRRMRAELERGQAPALAELARLVRSDARPAVAFDLPWPWGGERFELHDISPLTFIVGPLFSGKTRLAQAIASNLPGGVFIGLDRADGVAAQAAMNADPDLRARVERALAWLVEDGAAVSPALVALLVALEAEGPQALVIDMVEQGLDQATQQALMAHLRRAPATRPLFLMTRSNAILDLAAVGSGEAILFCPANHSPPSLVAPYQGASGYEAVATCLASPEVRKRTAGVIAVRPQVA